MARAVFGRDERKALEDQHKKFVDIPGPGMYEAPSDFGRYEPPQVKNSARFGIGMSGPNDMSKFSARHSPKRSML